MSENFLNNQKNFALYDPQAVGKSIELLPDQIRQILSDAPASSIPPEYSEISNIVVAGMGGSNLGAHFVKSALADSLKYPLTINAGYQVPAFVNAKTLYILSSYSGMTEEPLSTYREAKKRKAKILGITEDSPKSQIKKLLNRDHLPVVSFKPLGFNPSNQPRMALGFAITSLLAILKQTGCLKLDQNELVRIISRLELNTRRLRAQTANNPAKKIALNLKGKIPVLISAEHLTGNLQIMRNQINENAKNFACALELPDLNHYALEGLGFPKSNRKNLFFLIFDSVLYHPRNRQRLQLTKKVAQQNGISVQIHLLKENSSLGQAFELLQFGSWTGYYLSIANRINPAPIPFVDWFKKQLA